MAEEVWITRQELAARWKMPTATLAQWASHSRGVKYARFGRHCRYKLSDVIAYEDAQLGGDDAA